MSFARFDSNSFRLESQVQTGLRISKLPTKKRNNWRTADGEPRTFRDVRNNLNPFYIIQTIFNKDFRFFEVALI